jgi:hypothetical protein
MPAPRPDTTVQVNVVVAKAPELSLAVSLTVLVPGVVGRPAIVPEVGEIDSPAGSPVAAYDRDFRELLSLAGIATETGEPAMPSCGPGLAIVTGRPSCAEETERVPDSGRLADESPTLIP